MTERSKRISLYDPEKVKQINSETMDIFKKYQMDMSIRGLSDKTIAQYSSDLMQWFIFMYNNQYNLSVLEVSDDDLEEYFYWRKQQGNNTNRQKRVMSSISAFYRFLRKKRYITESPMEFIERPKKGLPIVTQTYLTKEQVQLMREVLSEHRSNIQLQAYAFVSLTTMARVNAIANLRWEQIDWEERTFSNVLEKEGKIVELSFSEEASGYLKQLQQYRAEHGINDHGWVFISQYVTDTKPINTGTLNDWCKVIGDMIGVPTLHPHDFRHSYASLLRNEGVALEDISTMLNHSGTDVTQKFYIKTNTSLVRKIKDSVII